jgi:putative transposase
VSRTLPLFYRKFQVEDMRWSGRSLADEPIGRLILDGKVVRVRLDREATSISLLMRADGHKVLLTVKSMGRRDHRGLAHGARRSHSARPAAAGIPDRRRRAPGLENASAAVWDGVPVQRCTVHKHRNLLAHAPLAPA